MPKEIVLPDLKTLAEQLKYRTKTLLKDLEPRGEEACRLYRLTEEAGYAEAEFIARLYLHAVQGLLSDVRDAHGSLKYLLGDIDAEGELYYYGPNKRFRLPGKSGLPDDYLEFTCGMQIEIWNAPGRDHIDAGEWSSDRVEYSDAYGGYYLYYAKKPLAPGMRARHRFRSPWDD